MKPLLFPIALLMLPTALSHSLRILDPDAIERETTILQEDTLRSLGSRLKMDPQSHRFVLLPSCAPLSNPEAAVLSVCNDPTKWLAAVDNLHVCVPITLSKELTIPAIVRRRDHCTVQDFWREIIAFVGRTGGNVRWADLPGNEDERGAFEICAKGGKLEDSALVDLSSMQPPHLEFGKLKNVKGQKKLKVQSCLSVPNATWDCTGTGKKTIQFTTRVGLPKCIKLDSKTTPEGVLSILARRFNGLQFRYGGQPITGSPELGRKLAEDGAESFILTVDSFPEPPPLQRELKTLTLTVMLPSGGSLTKQYTKATSYKDLLSPDEQEASLTVGKYYGVQGVDNLDGQVSPLHTVYKVVEKLPTDPPNSRRRYPHFTRLALRHADEEGSLVIPIHSDQTYRQALKKLAEKRPGISPKGMACTYSGMGSLDNLIEFNEQGSAKGLIISCTPMFWYNLRLAAWAFVLSVVTVFLLLAAL